MIQAQSQTRQTPIRQRPDVRSSEVVIRNHDHNRSYTVTVDVERLDAPAETHDIGPGTVRCLSVGPHSAVQVEARIATGASDTAQCELGSQPDETALIEVGNGLISVTNGV